MPKPRSAKVMLAALAAATAALALTAWGASAASASSAAGAAGATKTTVNARNCSFTLKLGDVLPFTGDLAPYGANLDQAVKLAVSVQNAALRKLGLANKIQVQLADSQDSQSQASAAVEATRKEVGEGVDVVIGAMASNATIPMAQSVTIPHGVVLISPTSSAPQLTTLKDKGYVWRTYPSDTLQGKVLAQAAVQRFGKGAVVNVGSRNDAFGTALKQLFVKEYTKLGGKIGVNIAWNPSQPTFDSEAQKLVSGNPKGWVIIDFPETFQKMEPALVRTGQWSASKTLMTEALRNADTLDKIGSSVIGLSGTAASAAGGPAGKAFHKLWNKDVHGAKPFTGFEGTSFDAANVAFLAALRACSAKPAAIKKNLVAVSGPPGTKVTFQRMVAAIRLALARKPVNYEGAFSPVDFDAHGDVSSAVFDIWQYKAKGKIVTLKTVTFRSK